MSRTFWFWIAVLSYAVCAVGVITERNLIWFAGVILWSAVATGFCPYDVRGWVQRRTPKKEMGPLEFITAREYVRDGWQQHVDNGICDVYIMTPEEEIRITKLDKCCLIYEAYGEYGEMLDWTWEIEDKAKLHVIYRRDGVKRKPSASWGTDRPTPPATQHVFKAKSNPPPPRQNSGQTTLTMLTEAAQQFGYSIYSAGDDQDDK